jgi:hypothetical protein
MKKFLGGRSIGRKTSMVCLALVLRVGIGAFAQDRSVEHNTSAQPLVAPSQQQSVVDRTTEAPSATQDAQNALSAARTDRDLGIHELTFGDRVRIYRHSVFSPLTLFGPAVGAGFGLLENEPPEWGQGAAGYGRRFGSSIGRSLSNKTFVFSIAAIDGEDPRYFPSRDGGILARSGHAIASTFVSYRGDGSRMPAISVFAGAYGSAFLANTWYPPSKATTRHALEQGTSKLGSTVGLHLLREFWPDIKRGFHIGRQ